MEMLYVVWTAVLVVHLPLLALPWMYRHYSDRDPIRCQGPTTLLFQNVATVVLTFEQILRALLSRVLPVAVEVLLSETILAVLVTHFLFYVVRLYAAFSKTAEQIAMHETMATVAPSQLSTMSRRIRFLKILNSPSTARLYIIAHVTVQNVLQIVYMHQHAGLAWLTLHEAETTRTDEFGTLANIAVFLDLIPVIAFTVLAWKMRVVVDAFGIKPMLRKVGWCTLVAITVFISTKDALNAASDLYIPYMVTVSALDLCLYFLFIQPVLLARRSPPRPGSSSDNVIQVESAGGGVDEFIEFLRTPSCFAAFKRHLETEFSIESLLFWADVDAFRSLPKAQMTAASEAIFDKYLRVDAPFEINLPSKSLRQFRDVLFNKGKVDVGRALSDTMFDAAAREMLSLMRTGSLPRFQETNPNIWSDFQYAIRERHILSKLNAHDTTASRWSSSTADASVIHF